MPEEGKYIVCTPVGLQTQDGIKRVNKAESAWSTATANLANAMEQVWKDISEGDASRHEIYEEYQEEIEDLIEVRAKAQDEFMRAIAGRL